MYTIWSHHTPPNTHQLPHLGLSPLQPHPHPEYFNHAHYHHPTSATEDLGHVQVLVSKQKFLVKLDTRGYSPDDLEIETQDGFLTIQGETGECGGEDFKTTRKFCRRFFLPLNCKEDELRCDFGGLHDGYTSILRVTIPREVLDEEGKLHDLVSTTDKGWMASRFFTSPPPFLSHEYYGRHDHPGHYPGQGHFAVVNGYFVSGVECNREKFVLRLKLARFCPEEISVKTVDDYLVVEGVQGEKEDGIDGKGGVFASCSFRRRYLLPLNADRDGIRCEFDVEEGRLKVIVPRIGRTNLHHLDKTDDLSCDKIYRIERK